MDNTSVNFGRRSGILSRLQRESCPHLYGIGCPCHIIHNTAEQGYKAFTQSSGFDLEELAVDLCYWFDKSTKRKAELESYSQFCDVQYRQVLDFCSTRWLCMQEVIKRVIDMYEPLRSYFCSVDREHHSRFDRLNSVFTDPMTIIYLHFYNHALPVFDNLNLLLQRQDPQIHRLQPSMHSFIKKCLLRIIDPSKIASVDIWTCNTASLSLLSDDEVNIGVLADEGVSGLLESGDVDNHHKAKFIAAVKTFWTSVHRYATSRLPYNDEVLLNSQWIDFFRRSEAKFVQVKYFVYRFPALSLTPNEIDSLRDEFDDYKTLSDEEVDVESCLVNIEYKDSFGNLDAVWGNIGNLQSPASEGSQRFPHLTRVASIPMAIPHSNADEERIFSSVRKDKTAFRASMELDRTLSSLLICQLNNDGDCLSYEPSSSVVMKSKKVTKAYNIEHSKNK